MNSEPVLLNRHQSLRRERRTRVRCQSVPSAVGRASGPGGRGRPRRRRRRWTDRLRWPGTAGELVDHVEYLQRSFLGGSVELEVHRPDRVRPNRAHRPDCGPARRPRTVHTASLPRGAYGAGSEVSRRDLLEHVDIKGLVGDQLLESGVLGLEFFEAVGVIGFHAAVLGHPAMPGRLGDLQMPAHLGQFLPRPEQLVALGQRMIWSGVCRRRLFAAMLSSILPAQTLGQQSRTTTGPLRRAHLTCACEVGGPAHRLYIPSTGACVGDGWQCSDENA